MKNFIQVINPDKIKYVKKMSKKNWGPIFWTITGLCLFRYYIRKWKIGETCQCILSGRRYGDSLTPMERMTCTDSYQTIHYTRKKCSNAGGNITVFLRWPDQGSDGTKDKYSTVDEQGKCGMPHIPKGWRSKDVDFLGMANHTFLGEWNTKYHREAGRRSAHSFWLVDQRHKSDKWS